MSNIKQIKQVSIKDNKLKATIEVYNERTADSYQTSYQNECPIHEEFTLAMANLNFHVEKICGTCFPGLRAEGFYRQPSGDSELLTIYAVNRADDNTCPVNLAARLHLGPDEYAWIDRLLEDLSLCEREALLYITQGKRLGMERFVEIGNTSDEPLNTAA